MSERGSRSKEIDLFAGETFESRMKFLSIYALSTPEFRFRKLAKLPKARETPENENFFSARALG